ncbi:sensor domain-containing diguanylate cyclase [Microbulbifer taiwanensis]|uniref:diguanylate cyclase n=1 Tax=Microbulbifer taiwanensis TaxID=986746 RepID=A0ABW1YKA6_9GAMM|nr:diguanylate cyclase [Microbulbifer taiwanensis]
MNIRLLLAACFLLATYGTALAEPLFLSSDRNGPLGKRAEFLLEKGGPLQFREAYSAWQRGQFSPGRYAIASHGIGADPVWMHLEIINDRGRASRQVLTLGKTWMDHLHVYIVREGRVIRSWKTGDAHAATPELVAGVGYQLPLLLPQGSSHLFIRAQTADPFVLATHLRSPAQSEASERKVQFGYSLLFGYLLALICYNLMLFLGFRSRSYLYYALYLGSFIAMCLAYSGHGFSWWWPDQLAFQRFVILVLMVVYGCCGFLIASRFLQLHKRAPGVRRWVIALCAAALMLMAHFIWLGSHVDAALLAFNFVTLFSAAMVCLGVLSIRYGQREGRYFLGAAICSMLGVASTALSVRGVIPMTALTYHGVEVGMALEATLLSLALARQVRSQEDALRKAERLSRIDALTGLCNRRAFYEDAAGIWSTAVRHARPLSVIVLDIDHFKSVNDRYGHQVGDGVLVEMGELLAKSCREGDRVARWGGEEFVVLLPETTLSQACLFAERLRGAVAGRKMVAGANTLSISISLGAAERDSQLLLNELVGEADRKLYEAKQQGRNRVAPARALEVAL